MYFQSRPFEFQGSAECAFIILLYNIDVGIQQQTRSAWQRQAASSFDLFFVLHFDFVLTFLVIWKQSEIKQLL